MRGDSFEEDNSARLRRRLWGAAVLIAIAVIVLPLLLDGAGTESQFRRVERLREEPSTIVDSEGNRTVQSVPETTRTPEVPETLELTETPETLELTETLEPLELTETLEPLELTEALEPLETPERPEIIIVSEEDKVSGIGSDVIEQMTGSESSEDVLSPRQSPMSAWVVRVEDYVDEQAALELRDRLRRAGFASFVRDREASTDPFSVLVGPMIKQETAEIALGRVAELLQNSPVIMNYP